MALRVLEALQIPVPANSNQSQMTAILGEPKKSSNWRKTP